MSTTPHEPQSPSRDLQRSPAMWLLLAIVTLGAVPRLWGVSQKSLWIDEGQTAYAAMLPISQIRPFVLADSDTCGPLYYAISHYAVRLAPYQAWALRLPAEVFGLLGLAMAYLVGTELFTRRWAGLVTAAAIAANRLHIHHSGEARNYTLYFLLSLVAMYCLARLARGAKVGTVPISESFFGNGDCPPRSGDQQGGQSPGTRFLLWAGFVLAGTGMILTHTVSFMFLAAMCVFYPLACWFNAGTVPISESFFGNGDCPPRGPAVREGQSPFPNCRKRGQSLAAARRPAAITPIVHIALAAGCIFLLYLPWLPVMLEQLRGVMQDCWIGRPTWTSAIVDLVSIASVGACQPNAALPAFVQGDVYWLEMAWPCIAWLAGIIGLAVYARRGDRRVAVLAICLAGAAAGVIAESMLARPVFMTKVVMPLTMAPALGLAAFIAAFGGLARSAGRLAAGFVAAQLVLGGGLAAAAIGTDTNAEWKESAAWVMANIQPGEPVLVNNEFSLRTVEWYLHDTPYSPVRWDSPTPTVLIPGGSVVPDGPPTAWNARIVASLKSVVLPGRLVWVIARGEMPLDAAIQSYLDSACDLVDTVKFDGVRVEVFRVRQSPLAQPPPTSASRSDR